MPKSSGREELSVLIGLEVLIEGIAFDTHDLRKYHFSSTLVTKVLKSLRQSGVLQKVNPRKYLIADRFSGALRDEILGKSPRNGLMQFPTMNVFDLCGIEGWTERDLENFAKRLRQHWEGARNRGSITKHD